jgi:hypothetical protein
MPSPRSFRGKATRRRRRRRRRKRRRWLLYD